MKSFLQKEEVNIYRKKWHFLSLWLADHDNWSFCQPDCMTGYFEHLVRAQSKGQFGRNILPKLADLPILSWGRTVNVHV